MVKGMHLTKPDATGALLPPEFYAVGIYEFEPWTPVDSICVINLINMSLSWNWS